MKTISSLLLMLLGIAYMITGCAHFHDEPTKSVWAGGVWIIPWATGLIAIYSWIQLYRSTKSGSKVYDNDPNSPTYGQWKDVPGKSYSKWFLFLAAGLTLFTIGMIIYQNLQK